jgi:hypothetical protein
MVLEFEGLVAVRTLELAQVGIEIVAHQVALQPV